MSKTELIQVREAVAGIAELASAARMAYANGVEVVCDNRSAVAALLWVLHEHLYECCQREERREFNEEFRRNCEKQSDSEVGDEEPR